MEGAPIHVLSTMTFPDAWLDMLRGVSERLVVVQHPADAVDEAPPEVWERVEVLYTGSAVPHPEQAPRLRWVQLDTAGVDSVLHTPLWRSEVAITTLTGVGPPTIAEYTMMMLLALAHRLPLMLEHQRRRDWPSPAERRRLFTPDELGATTLGVIGYGSIGRAIGTLAHAFGMRVLAMRRAATPATAADGGPDESYGPDHLGAMLAACDYVVLSVPLTSATFHMIDEAAFGAMKPGAILVNVARGPVVDEAALIRALREGRLGGAALDVFEEEPLPADSPLWGMPNVIISPHVAGLTPHYHQRIMGLFAQNLERYIAGEPLLNSVQREREY